MSDRLSLAKDRIRVLLLEGVNDSAVALFDGEGYSNLDAAPEGAGRPEPCARRCRAYTCSASARAPSSTGERSRQRTG